jgi:tetratricopeptide (TPR) repeat protein
MDKIFLQYFYIISCIVLTMYIPISIKSQNLSEAAKTYLEKIKSEFPDSVKEKVNLDDPQTLLRLGSRTAYFGNNERGNEIMRYAISKYPFAIGDDYHEWSVQNTKNGNYVTAIEALEKAVSLDPNAHGYYGWVLLYYYHDYTKALEHLEKFDKLTPNFTDAPGGEDIHFQKGLCQMKLKNYTAAIKEFDLNISEVSKKYGKKWTNPYCSLYKGRCLEQIHQLKKADKAYANAIAVDSNCTEAHYFKAMNLINMQKINAARPLLKKALTLIEKGNKQTDVYVELFDEIYKEDIEEAIKKYL